MSPQEQQTALQDLRESKRLELLGVRTPRHPETTETTESKRLYESWQSMVYGSLWQSMMSMVAAKTPHTFCCRFRHFAFFRHFCLSISTFSTCLGLPSPILRFDFGIFGYQVNLCPFCARRTLFDCVCIRHLCVSCMGEGAKETGLQMFTVYSMAIFWCEWHVRLRIPWLCGIEAPCLISCQQWLSHRFFVEDFP